MDTANKGYVAPEFLKTLWPESLIEFILLFNCAWKKVADNEDTHTTRYELATTPLNFPSSMPFSCPLNLTIQGAFADPGSVYETLISTGTLHIFRNLLYDRLRENLWSNGFQHIELHQIGSGLDQLHIFRPTSEEKFLVPEPSFDILQTPPLKSGVSMQSIHDKFEQAAANPDSFHVRLNGKAILNLLFNIGEPTLPPWSVFSRICKTEVRVRGILSTSIWSVYAGEVAAADEQRRLNRANPFSANEQLSSIAERDPSGIGGVNPAGYRLLYRTEVSKLSQSPFFQTLFSDFVLVESSVPLFSEPSTRHRVCSRYLSLNASLLSAVKQAVSTFPVFTMSLTGGKAVPSQNLPTVGHHTNNARRLVDFTRLVLLDKYQVGKPERYLYFLPVNCFNLS